MLEIMKTVGLTVLSFGLGFLSKRWLDNDKSKTEHDIKIFTLLDSIANEDSMRSVYNGARSSFHIGPARYDFHSFLFEAQKTSNKFIYEKIESKKEAFLKSIDELLGYYSIEGLPTKNGDQSVDPSTMDGPFDRDRERIRFEQEVMPKSDKLAEAFLAAFIDYRNTVKRMLKV